MTQQELSFSKKRIRASRRHLTPPSLLPSLRPPQIAESLPLSYFNTFGGGNLAMALGEATLDVVLKEKLQEKAERLGTMLRNMFEGLAKVGV